MNDDKKGTNVECKENKGNINVTQNGDIYSYNVEAEANKNIVTELNDIQEIIDNNFMIRVQLHKEYLKSICELSKSDNVWWEADCEFVFEDWYRQIEILNKAIENALAKLNALTIKLYTKCIEFKEIDYKLFKLLEQDKDVKYEHIIEIEGKRVHIIKDFLAEMYPENIECLEEKYQEILKLFGEKIQELT